MMYLRVSEQSELDVDVEDSPFRFLYTLYRVHCQHKPTVNLPFLNISSHHRKRWTWTISRISKCLIPQESSFHDSLMSMQWSPLRKRSVESVVVPNITELMSRSSVQTSDKLFPWWGQEIMRHFWLLVTQRLKHGSQRSTSEMIPDHFVPFKDDSGIGCMTSKYSTVTAEVSWAEFWVQISRNKNKKLNNLSVNQSFQHKMLIHPTSTSTKYRSV